jgi:hypothetical protein
MLESKVGEVFANVFNGYQIWAVDNVRVAGWPDRFLQLEQSRIFAVEFKIFTLNRFGGFAVHRFKSEQAAWFAKWQRYGGLCCIFYALLSNEYKLLGFSYITCQRWQDWLDVPNHKYSQHDIRLFTGKDMARELHNALIHFAQEKVSIGLLDNI